MHFFEWKRMNPKLCSCFNGINSRWPKMRYGVADLVQHWIIKVCYLNGMKPSLKPMLIFCHSSRSHFTHWGRVTHICVSKLTIIGSDNGMSPRRHQAIISSNAGILLIGTLGTNFSEGLSKFHTFSFKKMHLKMPSGKWRPFCLGLNVLRTYFNAFKEVIFVLSIMKNVCDMIFGSKKNPFYEGPFS